MGEQMTFPDTWEEFEECYGFTDNEQIYTNGSRLIQSFRVKQWLDHLPSAQQKGRWVLFDGYYCSVCSFKLQTTGLPSFCPNCGADMRGED